MYSIRLTEDALKDQKKIKESSDKVLRLFEGLKKSPYSLKSFKKLTGNLKGAYSIRINLKHRIVFTIKEETKTIIILSMWGHYND